MKNSDFIRRMSRVILNWGWPQLQHCCNGGDPSRVYSSYVSSSLYKSLPVHFPGKCNPPECCILATATSRGWHSFYSELLIVCLVFKGGVYWRYLHILLWNSCGQVAWTLQFYQKWRLMLLGWSRKPVSSSSEANNSMTKYSISTQPTANNLTSTNWARLNSALHAISFLNCQKEQTHVQIYCNCMSSEYLSHTGSQRQKL